MMEFRYMLPGTEANQIAFFKSRKRPFSVIRSAYSTMIKNEHYSTIVSDRRMWMKHLGLITRLKNWVRKNVKDPGTIQYRRVYDYNEQYFPNVEGTVNPVTETDLSGAYISCALRLSIIQKELHDSIREVNKFYRLKILGSLGTRKIQTDFDESGNVVGTKTVTDPHLRNVWHLIVQTVNEDLREQADKDQVWVMYWVDNYFTQNPDTSTLTFQSKGYGLKSSSTDILYRKSSNQIGMFLPDQRSFTMPRKDIAMSNKVSNDEATAYFKSTEDMMEPVYQNPSVEVF